MDSKSKNVCNPKYLHVAINYAWENEEIRIVMINAA